MGAETKCGEGNGKPLQYSCLENPMDGGAWWAAVHGVARSRTRLKRLSSSSSSRNKVTSISARKSGVQFCAWSVFCSDTGSQHGCSFPTWDPNRLLIADPSTWNFCLVQQTLTTSRAQRFVGLSRVEPPAALEADVSTWREQRARPCAYQSHRGGVFF